MVYGFLALMKFQLEPDNDEAVLTNAVFALVGLFATALLGFPGIVLGISLVYLGFASGWYHFHDRHAYAWGDWSAMYMVYTSFIGYMSFMYTGKPYFIVVWLFVGFMLSALHNGLPDGKKIDTVFIGALYAVTVFLSFLIIPVLYAWVSVGTYAVAYSFRVYAEQDGPKSKGYDKEQYDTFHGMWHLFAALGMFITVLGLKLALDAS